MDAAHDTRRQLGQLMVDEGFLSVEQLNHALAQQSQTGRPLGAILVELGYVSAGAVGNALAEQHGGLLKTEFGISAGLQGSAPRQALAPPPPDPLAARVHELESQLHAVLTERNVLAQNVNELQARLSEAAQTHDAEIARATAAAAARIAALEAELRASLAAREETEAAIRLGAARVAELEHELAKQNAPREPTPERAHLLLVPSPRGYRLIECSGPAPASGTLLDVDGVTLVAGRVGAAPLPGNHLRCVFLASL